MLFQKNVDLGPALKISSWRKIAIGTWRTVGDPSVYGYMDIDAEPALAYIEKLKAKTGQRITMSHYAGKVFAEAYRKHPGLNTILRFGKLYPRNTIDIFFQVATDTTGEDLSGMVVRDADKKSVVEIAQVMDARVKSIRDRTDTSYTQMKGLMKWIPSLLVQPLLDFTGFLMYSLNLWSPLLGVPRDSFGTLMITNIGSLGMHTAFAPIVPYSRVPCLCALGGVTETPVVRDGKIVIGKMIRLNITLDHRLIDGMEGSQMAKTLIQIFTNPERELGNI